MCAHLLRKRCHSTSFCLLFTNAHFQARAMSFDRIRASAAAASPANRTLVIADDTLHLPSMRRVLWNIARQTSAAIRCTARQPTCSHPEPYTTRSVASTKERLTPSHPSSFVHITGPTDVLLQRNSSRPRSVPSSSLLKIISTLHPPLPSKHYYETPVLTLHCVAPPRDNALVVANWLAGCWKVNVRQKALALPFKISCC